MANPWAGEVALVIGGERHVMRLTLGALAGGPLGVAPGWGVANATSATRTAVPVGPLLAEGPAAGWNEAAAEVNLTALGAGQVPGYVLANGTALLVSALLQNLTTAETRAFFGALGFDLSAFSFGNFMGGRGFDWSAFDVFGVMSGFGFGGGGGGYEADAPFDPFADDPFGNK